MDVSITSPLTPVVLAIIHENATPDPTCTAITHYTSVRSRYAIHKSRRTDAACSTDNSHSTPPTTATSPLDGTVGVKQEHSEQSEDGAVVCESMDHDDGTSVKRHKVTGRYRMRAKKEVIRGGSRNRKHGSGKTLKRYSSL